MRIFITGGTGFIGKSVLAELAGKKHDILVLTRTENPVRIGKNISFIEGDLANIPVWSEKLEKFKPEIVIHLAWEGIPDFSPEQCLKNISQNMSLFNYLGSLKIKRIVTSGSCFEYGSNKNGRLSEDTPPGDLNTFSLSKREIHTKGETTAKRFGYEFIWTRLFYVYGPEQRKGSLIPSLVNAKLENLPSPIKNPDAANDFIFVTDVARALVKLALAKTLPYNTFNIGSGSLTSVSYISDLIYEKQPKKQKKTENGFWADLSRIKKAVEWEPEVPIEKGVASVVNFLSHK